jgi:hypothetical protein
MIGNTRGHHLHQTRPIGPDHRHHQCCEHSVTVSRRSPPRNSGNRTQWVGRLSCRLAGFTWQVRPRPSAKREEGLDLVSASRRPCLKMLGRGLSLDRLGTVSLPNPRIPPFRRSITRPGSEGGALDRNLLHPQSRRLRRRPPGRALAAGGRRPRRPLRG